MWDPKWFHDFKSPQHIFKDKNDVYNGLTIPCFRPGEECHGLCHGRDNCKHSPDSCSFLSLYKLQLNQLDFNQVISDLTELSQQIRIQDNLIQDPDIILIVYEVPENPCSESHKIIEWFKEHGYDLKWWTIESICAGV